MSKVVVVTKSDIVKAISGKYGEEITKTAIAVCLDAVLEEIIIALISGKKVAFNNFGTFQTRDKAANPFARNPKTGETVEAPALRRVKFKAGKLFKDSLAGAKLAEEV